MPSQLEFVVNRLAIQGLTIGCILKRLKISDAEIQEAIENELIEHVKRESLRPSDAGGLCSDSGDIDTGILDLPFGRIFEGSIESEWGRARQQNQDGDLASSNKSS